MNKRTALAAALAVGAVMAFGATDARANVTFTGTGTNSATNDSLSASVTFAVSGDILTITLENLGQATANSSVLTAVFFSVDGNPGLTPGLGTPGGCIGTAGDPCPGTATDIGKGWDYKNGLNQYSANQGIGTAGFSIFGPTGDFSGGGTTVDGRDDGILKTGTAITGPGTDGLGNSGGPPYALDSMTFVLTGATGLTDQSFTNVTFQFGTALTEPHVSGTLVPVPAALPIMAAALAGFGFAGWRTQRKAA